MARQRARALFPLELVGVAFSDRQPLNRGFQTAILNNTVQKTVRKTEFLDEEGRLQQYR